MNVRSESSVNVPAVVRNGSLLAVSEETVRLVVEAVFDVIAVVEANGKVLNEFDVEVMAPAMSRVEVAVIAPPKKEEPEV